MKVPAALLSLALASAVAAQGGNDLPTCASSCATKFLNSGIGNCGTDMKCICENKDFLGSIACCLTDVCDEKEQAQAIDYAVGVCGGVEATGLPTQVVCSTAASTSAPTPTGTGNADENTESTSTNFGPRPTAAAGLGAIGGIIAAVALL